MTQNEQSFLRELRKLLKAHDVVLEQPIDDEGYVSDFTFTGPDISLDVDNVALELLTP